MNIIVLKEPGLSILLKQFRVKIHFEVKDGTLVRYGVRVSDCAFITRFGNQSASVIRIQGAAKYIEEEVSFSYKADAKRVTVLWL